MDDVFEAAPAIDKRPASEISRTALQHVERDQDGRRAQDTARIIAQQMEATHERFVEDGDFAVEHRNVSVELGDRGRQLAKTPGVVDAVA